MSVNLTNSYCDRQKILNNPILVREIEKHLNIYISLGTIPFKTAGFATKQWIGNCFEVSTQTIDECIATNQQELKASGYILIEDAELEEFLASCDIHSLEQIGNCKINDYRELEINKVELFTFTTWLNIVMLLPGSQRAEFVRNRILDIVIDLVAKREGLQIRYVNQSLDHWNGDVGYGAVIYSNSFSKAAKQYLKLDNAKQDSLRKGYELSLFIMHYHEIYKLVFGEKYQGYKNSIANNVSSYSLDRIHREREGAFYLPFKGHKLYLGLYYEVCQAIFSLEAEVSQKMQLLSQQQGRKITRQELDNLVLSLKDSIYCQKLIEEAKSIMSIIDYFYSAWGDFETTFNKKLEAHYQSLAETEEDKFISAKNKSLKEKLSKPETLAIFQRLKNR